VILVASCEDQVFVLATEDARATETEDGGGDWNHGRSSKASHQSTIPVFQTSDAPPPLSPPTGYGLPVFRPVSRGRST
jgi:hypothetical protein